MSQNDSETRRKRDAALRTIDQQIAAHLEQARQAGELRHAPSYGKPMVENDGFAQTPTEFRMPFKILKNADVVPPEIELFHRRASLREQIDACASEAERIELMRRLSELEQLISMRLEHFRVSGSI